MILGLRTPWLEITNSFATIRPSGGARRLRSGVGESRRRLVGLRQESALQQPKRCRRIIGVLEQLEILAIDHAMTHQCVEVDDLSPIAGSVQNHRDRTFELARLCEGQNLGEFIQRAEDAWKHPQPARAGPPGLCGPLRPRRLYWPPP